MTEKEAAEFAHHVGPSPIWYLLFQAAKETVYPMTNQISTARESATKTLPSVRRAARDLLVEPELADDANDWEFWRRVAGWLIHFAFTRQDEVRYPMSIAEIAAEFGFKRSFVWKVMHGKTAPTYRLMSRLSDRLGVSFETLRKSDPDERYVPAWGSDRFLATKSRVPSISGLKRKRKTKSQG